MGYQLGIWGFTLKPPSLFAGQPFAAEALMYATVPGRRSRFWTVTMSAYRFSGGPLVGAAIPPDNQTDATPQYQVTVFWGSENATESAILDYPTRGVRFGVHGSQVRVGVRAVTTGTTVTTPNLSGFISPSVGSSDQQPTLTFNALTVPALGNLDVPIPARAIGYRVTPQLQLPPLADIYELRQLGTPTLPLQSDAIVPSPGSGDDLAGSRALWYPLHPMAQLVRVAGLTVTPVTVNVQFVLDMN